MSTLLLPVQTCLIPRFIDQQIDWKHPLIGIIGGQASGKTSFLQLKKDDFGDKALYLNAGDFKFTHEQILDHLTLFEARGGNSAFIDDFHRQPDWISQLISIRKALPKFQIIFSIPPIHQHHRKFTAIQSDGKIYQLPSFSFREYLAVKHQITAPPLTLEEILSHQYLDWLEKSKIRPLALFEDYLHHFNQGDALEDLGLSLERELVQFAQLKASTGFKLKHLCYLLANQAPDKPNTSQLALAIDMSRPSLNELLQLLEQAEIIHFLKKATKGIKAIRPVDKLFFGNLSTYREIIKNQSPQNLYEAFAFTHLKVKHELASPEFGDFLVDEKLVLAVGEKARSKKELKALTEAIKVNPLIEKGEERNIPLWALGLLY
ncbi:AAA family ATPase [Persicobacter diffluens]|uniref:ATPase AAA n=1 Tax=Persicobacter diffluens TaxID=981 RepID=A0AAN4VZX6_9BACT|nr:ATPase AAA [Persicobacter diffluens]